MATLFNTKIKDTYQSLLKLEDNTILTTTSKNITDGLGNASPLYLSTTQVRIGSNSASAMYWDNTNNRLGIGTSSPTNPVSIGGVGTNGSVSFNRSSDAATQGYIGTLGTGITLNGGTSFIYMGTTNTNAIGTSPLTTLGAMWGIRGSGSTSATTSLLVQNSAGTELLKVQDDGTTTIRQYVRFLTDGLQVNGFGGGVGGLTLTGTPPNANQIIGAQGLSIVTSTTFNATTGAAMNFGTADIASTSGDISNFLFGGQPNMQSGNASFSQLRLQPNFTTGGTYSGIARGIYYAPSGTLTGVTSHRAIETVSGDVLFGTTSGKVGIGIIPDKLLTVGSPNYGGWSNGEPTIKFNKDLGVLDSLSIAGDSSILYLWRSGAPGNGSTISSNYNGSGGSLRLGVSSRTDVNIMQNNGDVTIGNNITTLGAKLGIKGNGSTNATTSLLVQNNGGTNLLQVKDNGDLVVGTVASGLGTIYVPHDSSYGTRGFLAMQNGGNMLMSTVSNSQLLLNGSMFNAGSLFLTAINYGIVGKSAFQNNNTSILLQGDVNAYNGTNQDDASNIVLLGNTNSTLQANGSMNFLKIIGSVNEAGGGGAKFLCGIYYKPTITGGTALNNSHYCYWATSGQMMVNTTSPNASAQLQVDSTTRGFLPPRVTTAQKNAISSPAEGLFVYDSDLKRPCFFNGTSWVTL